MWFWNRIEIYQGNSMSEFNRLREILAGAGVHYDYKLVNNARYTHRSHIINDVSKINTQYYLYVHKKDIETAKFYIYNQSC